MTFGHWSELGVGSMIVRRLIVFLPAGARHGRLTKERTPAARLRAPKPVRLKGGASLDMQDIEAAIAGGRD